MPHSPAEMWQGSAASSIKTKRIAKRIGSYQRLPELTDTLSNESNPYPEAL